MNEKTKLEPSTGLICIMMYIGTNPVGVQGSNSKKIELWVFYTVHRQKLGFSAVSRVSYRVRVRVRFSFRGYLCPMR